MPRAWACFRLVYLPAWLRRSCPPSLAAFAFALGAYEPAAVLGVQRPRTLAVVAVEWFRHPTRPDGPTPSCCRRCCWRLAVAVALVAWAADPALVVTVPSGAPADGRRGAVGAGAWASAPWAWSATCGAASPPVVVLVLSAALSSLVVLPRRPAPAVVARATLAAVLARPPSTLGRARAPACLLERASVTVIAVIAAWPAARVLADRGSAGGAWCSAVLFLPSLLPAVGLAMGIDVALLRVGLAGRVPGVVLAHLVPTLPYAVGVLTAVFVRHDDGTERQAAMLGASPWQRFRLVTLPLVRPGLAVAAVLVFLVSWSQYLLTLLVGFGAGRDRHDGPVHGPGGGNPTPSPRWPCWRPRCGGRARRRGPSCPRGPGPVTLGVDGPA